MLAGCTPWPDAVAAAYREAGYWQGQTFGEMLRERATRHGDRVAVVSGEDFWKYQELDTQVDRLVAGLVLLGIQPQDRVVVQLPNVGQFLEVSFALFRLGAIPVFALPAHRSSEIVAFCEQSEAVAYVIPDVHDGFDYRVLAEEVRASVRSVCHVIVVGETDGHCFSPLVDLYASPVLQAEPDASDVALFQLSGGTTGVPKLIPRTHDDYLYSVRASAEICGLTQDSVYLGALPVAHNFPMSSPGIFGTLYAGGKIVLAPGTSPDIALPLLERERVTITALVPPLARIWLEAADSGRYDLSSLKVLQVGGAKLSEDVARRIGPTFGCTLQQVFGMAEGLVNYTRLDDDEETIVQTQGRPISPADELRIVDDDDRDVEPGRIGHLLTRGPYTIRGYYRADEHNAQTFTPDGFYRTGDLVRRLSSGHLIVEGRAKEQINRGGEKVAPDEVEGHLLAHPGLLDAAVVPMADRFLGERTCAFVIPHGAAPAASDLREFLRRRGLAAYKLPDRFEVLEAFPHTGVGKTSRRQLREALARSLDAGPAQDPHAGAVSPPTTSTRTEQRDGDWSEAEVGPPPSEVGPPPLPVLQGPWRIRLLDAEGADLDLIHEWMSRPHVEAGWHQAWSRECWAEELRRHLSGDHTRSCLLLHDGVPLAYLELYRVVRDRLAGYYPVQAHDLGVHVAIGDPGRIGRGLGRTLLREVADGLLAADPDCTRIVAEPNVQNEASLRAFSEAGFQRVGEIVLPHKTAALFVRPRTPADLPSLTPSNATSSRPANIGAEMR